MIELATFALSAALAQVLTNLDNLAALLALMLVVGPVRAVFGYVAAQVIVVCAAMAVALGMNDTVPGWTGYLGVIPLTLGLRGIWQQFVGSDQHDDAALNSGASVIVTTILFLTLSMDSFAVMTPLLADSTPRFRLAALIGAASAVAALGLVAVVGAHATGGAAGWLVRFEKLGPYAMALAGAYVLLNTGTDAIP